MVVFILGAGKVGRALARAARGSGIPVTLRAARRGLPARPIAADLLILAVRERDLESLSTALAGRRLVGRRTACVHVAGALDSEVLEPLRAVSAGVGQMHPMISFASTRVFPALRRGSVRVEGDRDAVVRASAFARRLGMSPRLLPGLDTVGYHAAAGLLANGAAALAAVSSDVLVRSGVPASVTAKMLAPLLRSVAENVERLGFPACLTGPIRRGDAAGVNKHLRALESLVPSAVPLYEAMGRAQLPLARALSDAPRTALAEIDALLRTARRPRTE